MLIWYGGIWEPSKHVPDLNRFLPHKIAVIGVETRTLNDGLREKVNPPVSFVMDDACRAVQFVRLNAAMWNLDPERIAVGGGSQGALPALYVGCAGDRVKPESNDPVERFSSKVTCVAAYRSQPSIDPRRMQEWVPGVKWGAPALGYSFDESLKRRDELLPLIEMWSPEALLHKGAAPIYFENNWGLTQPENVTEMDYKVHSPAWGLGFQKLAAQAGAVCHVKYPDHPTDRYQDIWDFIRQELLAVRESQAVKDSQPEVSRTDNWPGWRGPTGMGITDAQDLPLTWGGKDQENVLWKSPLPGSEGKPKFDFNQSSPIVWKDRVFLIMVYWPEGVAQTEFPEHHVACYRAHDGKLLWDVKVPPGPWLLKDLRGGYSAPTPCTDGERVYALFGSSELVALDFEGQLLWRKEITPIAWDVAIGTSPVLYQDTVLVLADGTQPKHSRLIAFHGRTGEVKWEQARPTSSFSHSTPVLVQVNGKPQLLVSASGAVQGLDPADGRVIWWAAHHGDVPTPVYGQGLVYSEDGRGGAGIAVAPTGEGDVTKTLVKWKTAPVPEGYSSPTISGDFVYRAHNPGVLKCWRLADGELVYQGRLPNSVSHVASPFVTPQGRIYFAGGGTSAVIAPGPKFEVLATSDLGDPSPASAAVAGGRIYIKGERHLHCIGKK